MTVDSAVELCNKPRMTETAINPPMRSIVVEKASHPGYGDVRDLKITFGLNWLKGNRMPHFSVTCEYRYPNQRRGYVAGCGAAHDLILSAKPDLADLVALHLSDGLGTPMHAVANAIYWASGVVDLRQRFTPKNGGGITTSRTTDECLSILKNHLRTTDEETAAFVNALDAAIYNTTADGPHLSAMLTRRAEDWLRDNGLPDRWEAEANAAMEKHALSIPAKPE